MAKTNRLPPLTHREFSEFLEALPASRRTYATLMARAGLSPREIEYVTASDVLGDGYLRIGGRHARLIPVVSDVATALNVAASGKNSRDPIVRAWPSRRHDLPNAFRRAGLEPRPPTELRRAYVAWLNEIGVSESVVAALVGRRVSRALLDRFRPTLKDLRSGVARLEGAGR